MRRNRIGRATLRFGGPALLGALAMAAVVACTSGSSGSSSVGSVETAAAATQAPERAPVGEAGSAADAAAAATAAAPDPASGSGSGATAGSGEQQRASAPVDGSKVIRTATLSVRLDVQPVTATDDAAADREANARARSDAVAAAAGSIRGIAVTAGGLVAAADGGGSQLSITLRVPADQYDAVLDKIGGVGAITDRNESSQDVSGQIVDVNSRVASMTASVARVRALLDQATGVADIISIESELATREADLESLQQQQAYLQDQVAMSTVTVNLSAVTVPAPDQPVTEPDTGFVAGIKAGWDNLLGFLSWLGVLIGGLLPWLPLVAVVVGVLWWALRRVRRHRRRQLADPTGPAVDPANADAEPREPAGVS